MVSYETGWDSAGNYHSRRYEDGVLVSDIITTSATETINTSGSGSNVRTAAYDSTANDTMRGGVSNFVSGTVLEGSSNADLLNNFSSNVTAYGGAGNDTIYNGWFGDSALIKGGSDDDVIYNYANNVTVKGGSGNDNILTTGQTTIISGTGNDTITLREYTGDTSRGYVLVDAGAGADSISMAGFRHSTIIAGDGNDTVYSYGATNTNRGNILYGGAGNDYISGGGTKNDSSGETIIGGAGDDTIHIANGTSGQAVVQYANGDGNDVITNGLSFISFRDDYSNPKNIIYVAGEYTTIKSDNDLVVQVGDGSITLKDAGNYALSTYNAYLNIDTMSAVASAPDIDSSDDNSDDLAAGSSYAALSNDSQDDDDDDDNSHWYDNIVDRVEDFVGDTVDLIKRGLTYVYEGGTRLIRDYVQGEQINLVSDFLGIGLDDNNFYINSSSGRLSIENVRDKVISYGNAAGNLIAYSYMAAGGGEIDWHYFPQCEVIIGADYVPNKIIAGTGGSSLWGGNGGNDTLVGGDGYDEFFYTIGNGLDVIQNAASNDIINLLGVTLEQIAYTNVTELSVGISFVDGGYLHIEGNTGAGYNVGGTIYVVNQSTQEWSTR